MEAPHAVIARRRHPACHGARDVPSGHLVRELYARPTIPDAYRQRMQQPFDTTWNEAALLAEIDRMETLITPYAGDVGTYGDAVRTFVSSRRAKFEAEWAGGPPVRPLSPLATRQCFDGPSFLDVTSCPKWLEAIRKEYCGPLICP